MRSFYLSLAVVALSLDITGAVSSASGLLRERKEEEHERRVLNGSGTKGSKGKSGGTCGSSGSKGKGKGKGKSAGALSPVCPGETVGKSKGKGKGKGKSDDTTTRFLEDVRFLSKGKGKGKGKSSGGDDCDCDYPTDLCEGEDVTTMENQIVCGQLIEKDTVLSTPLGCDVGNGANQVPAAVVVDGATLECTGDGDNPIYGTGGISNNNPCVVLRNGATLKNCHVYLCGIGVVMQGQGNNRVVGSKLYQNAMHIETAPDPGMMAGFGQAPFANPMGLLDSGCYSVECTMISGGGQEFGVKAAHDGTFIMSDVEMLGVANAPVVITPLLNYDLDVAFENMLIVGSSDTGANVRSSAIFIGQTSAGTPPWGKVGEVGFFGFNKFVAHLFGVREDWTGSENELVLPQDPASIMVYGSVESYDTWRDGFEINNAALLFEECSIATACTTASDGVGPGVSFDIGNALGFMDMGAEFTCMVAADPATLQNAAGMAICPSNMCPPAPTTAFSCSGDSGTSKSKGKGKGSNGSKGKGKSATTP